MQWEKVELAARMQNYIRDHCMDADFTMDALYEAARVFTETCLPYF